MNCHASTSQLRDRRVTAGFTMVEIAIALGVIGFALVAIIGILPAGLEVQRDNRSETIINQDATLWLTAISSGAMEMESLPHYVENISLIERNPVDNSIVSSNRWALQGSGNPATSFYQTGADIIGLITWAAGAPDREVRVQATAFSGSAAEKELDPKKRELAFSYLMRVVIDPKRDPESDLDDTALPFAAVTGEMVQPEEHFGYSEVASPYPDAVSLTEIRLTFSYPFIGESKTPPRSQTFRTSVARQVVNDPITSVFFFLRP